MSRIFIICPVRLGIEEEVTAYVSKLEQQGHMVYYPPRDTSQVDEDTGGYQICSENKKGIMWADEVHVWYRGDSQGIHFDLGMAFALKKKIKMLNEENLFDFMPANYSSKGNKSYPLMLKYWSKCE